jgi:hypothetical protein
MGDSFGVLAELPSELQYLAEPAMKYGANQYGYQVDQFIQFATEEDLERLAAIGERIRLNQHTDKIDDFLDKYPITEYQEAANLYFLLGLIDAAGIDLEDETWNSVEKHISSLCHFGSLRLASKRMWAARFLADFGEQARSAIPYLRTSLKDEDLRVRVWAHYALAVIEGQREEHERAVRQIFSEHNQKDQLGCYDEVGMEALGALDQFK